MNSRLHLGVLVGTLSTLLVSSCVATSFRPAPNFEPRSATPVSPTTVRVFRSAAIPRERIWSLPGAPSAALQIYRALDPPPDQDLLPLGEIEAYVSGSASLETIIYKAREQAAAIGADAIIISPNVSWGLPAGGDVGQPGYVISEPTLYYVRFTAVRALVEHSVRHNP